MSDRVKLWYLPFKWSGNGMYSRRPVPEDLDERVGVVVEGAIDRGPRVEVRIGSRPGGEVVIVLDNIAHEDEIPPLFTVLELVGTLEQPGRFRCS